MPALIRSYVATAGLIHALLCLGLAQASPGPFLKQRLRSRPHLAAYVLSCQSARAGCGSAVVLRGAKGLGHAERQPCCITLHAQPSRHANQQAMRALRHCLPRTFSSAALAATLQLTAGSLRAALSRLSSL